jgi:hypothetical protein
VGNLAADFAFRDRETAGQHRPNAGERILRTCLDVGCPTNHRSALGTAIVDETQIESIRVGMSPDLFHLTNDQLGELRVERLHAFHGGPQHGEPFAEIVKRQRVPEEIL